MKFRSFNNIFIVFLLLINANSCTAQKADNWTSKELIEPAELARNISSKTKVPTIICIGPGATIPNSIDVGMVNSAEGIIKLKKQLSSVDKTKKLVIYCGCCPFEKCPNVRPAIEVLKEMKFTNYYLLNIPQNIKKDWIDKGYPVAKAL